MCLIFRDEHYFRCFAAGMDLVGSPKRENATLDSQTLFNDFELQKAWRFNCRDALY